jgi:hypothetical protein
MRPRRKIEFRRRTPSSHLNVAGRALANGHRTVRHVRHGQHKFAQGLIERRHALVRQFDVVRNLLHPRKNLAGIPARFLQPRNLLASLVPLSLQPLRRSNNLPPLPINFLKASNINHGMAILRHPLNLVEVPSEITQIKHRPSRIPETPAA